MKSALPYFVLSSESNIDLKEQISGKADMAKRMAGKLGTALRLLKRHTDMVMIVASADRIARRADVFELIQAQGLGHRIYDISTRLNLNEIIATGVHRRIEERTKKHERACKEGIEHYVKNGGNLGRSEIREHAETGSFTNRVLAKQLYESVLEVVALVAHRRAGKEVTLSEVCDELNDREVRTRQGNVFHNSTLGQLKKRLKGRWAHAADSYRRPRRRIRQIISASLIELRNRRTSERRRARLVPNFPVCILSNAPQHTAYDPSGYVWPIADGSSHIPHSLGCRGPPTDVSLADARMR